MTKDTKSKLMKNEKASSETNSTSTLAMGKEPDFGTKTTFTEDGVELSCSYKIPNHTLHDLVKIYNDAANADGNSPFSGNPSKWPTVAGVNAIVDICIKELYK